ncbi:hypothetical protein CY34DRAFT_813277 [Suillus luteus UH-Slu-Lm8-n1]|uniref:Uncharacterized protein n=1 Tax=Suillus luteus UH-Slu-Lm8-n1 TaxID=930992 RepID=A0A0D0AI38_9AGAM|nr:hypothetical protein CY34DRAFT_813277 [Suillus luteus UH-Slu-Lm8-n1]
MLDSLLENYGVADAIISSSLTLIKNSSQTHLYVHPVVGAWVVTCSLMEHLSAGSNEVVRVVLPVKGACRIIDHS